MKVQVTIKAILDTDDISNKGVKRAIEESAFNNTKNNLAGLWAHDEIDRNGSRKEIILELL